MSSTDTLVIGAGQAGLAASRHLTGRGREHVVLERGRPGHRWRTERWDSLRLLTPNWMNGLPYTGADPDGFMTAAEFADQLDRYAAACPVLEGCTVRSVEPVGDRFVVTTSSGDRWWARDVVVATGWCDRPRMPSSGNPAVVHLAPTAYRNPGSPPPGGVLVVGASATGVQLAHELARAGRSVVLAVGSHNRLPRRYRGRDIYRWLVELGSLDRTVDELPASARGEPSLQLVGGHTDLDLGVLRAAGVTLAGRLVGLDGVRARFAGDLPDTVAAAQSRMHRVLDRIDAGFAGPVRRPAPIRIGSPPRELDLRADGITSVLWATGHRRDHSWLPAAVLDGRGEIRQRRGVTPVPGLYVLGQRFQHRRGSHLIHGVGRDAAFVVDHILERSTTCATTTT